MIGYAIVDAIGISITSMSFAIGMLLALPLTWQKNNVYIGEGNAARRFIGVVVRTFITYAELSAFY